MDFLRLTADSGFPCGTTASGDRDASDGGSHQGEAGGAGALRAVREVGRRRKDRGRSYGERWGCGHPVLLVQEGREMSVQSHTPVTMNLIDG
ncbi:hypothetical protein GN958_ATG19602 [Phytophthora infestans]|uniref:Uncharacterized protein n=1 Tax=Phytophthora infestans TaxID=4787 RepID=A0A8S9TW11_PHYIN|nr:hypothetical protein GN958_ATG19602 [Phytophthora infestans]